MSKKTRHDIDIDIDVFLMGLMTGAAIIELLATGFGYF